ncbi:MAG: polysaccharide deacetylase family protein [Hyphomicrobiaceae bacterium]
MAKLTDRIPYSAIVDRKPLTLPGDARVAVWIIVNVEEWAIERAMPRTVLPPPMGQPLLPDVPNWAWHEYGMRVGYWRFMDVLERAGVKATLAINGHVCESYPRVAQAALDAGWEFMGHGFIQGPMHKVENQGEAIEQTVDAIRKFTGSAPRGWESPGLTETDDTLDLLRQAGIEYVADWVLDDQPVEIATDHGPMISVPYTVEINDIVISLIQHHPSDMLLQRGKDHFDQLRRDGETNARVMAISIHPYITGAPHRIRYLEELLAYIRERGGAVFMTGEEILDWYRAQTSDRD